MQRKGVRSLFILCKRYQLPPLSSNRSSSLPPFQELHSNTYSDFASSSRVSHLLHLQKDQPHDQFGADVDKVYGILKKFHTRVPKLELALQQSGVVVTQGLAHRVLARCGDAGNLGYMFFVWASKQPGYRHSRDVYRAMIESLAKMRQFGAVWALIEEMRNHDSEPLSPEVFIVLIRRFASAKMVKEAVEVLDQMPKYGCQPDENVFACLLDALCKNGSVYKAAVLLEDTRFNFRRTIRHFTSLLYGWSKEGNIIKAKDVLRKMKEEGFEPDIVVYNIVLNCYAVAGEMGDAFDLLAEMKKKGCDPNVTSFTIIIQSLCAFKRMEEAMRVLSDMDRSGCEADVRTYTTLIYGFVKWHQIEKAYLILDQMIQKGHPPSSTTYLYIMYAHERKDQLEECLDLKEEMLKIGVAPDVSIYNTIIRLAIKLGEVEASIRIWNEIEANGKSPQVDTFIIMISGLVEQGRLVEACDYFKEMVMRGLLFAPQYGTFKSLLNSLLRDNKLEMSKDVWNCVVTKGCELNKDAWTIWIHALFRNKHVKEACAYCMDMMDAGLMPRPATYVRLMVGLENLHNRVIAAEITEKVRKMAEGRQMKLKNYRQRGEKHLDDQAKRRSLYRKKGGARKSFAGHKKEIF